MHYILHYEITEQVTKLITKRLLKLYEIHKDDEKIYPRKEENVKH